MSSKCNHTDNVIFKRNGTDQENRFNEILNPHNLELHDFDLEDWILFAYNFAKHINFFKTDNDEVASGNWQELFNYFEISDPNLPKRTEKAYTTLKNNIQNTLSELETESKVTPHMTLFICFLKLLELSKKRFNEITKRHLDFYYKEILQLKKLPPTPDNVHIIFEIAKKSVEEKITVHTELDGGKDSIGKKRIYETKEEIIANKATVAQVKSLYNSLALQEIKSSETANSLDGKGKELPKDSNYWWPFGYTSEESDYEELEDAKLGFAIASPLFNLQEGERNVDITITFNEAFAIPPGEFELGDLIDNINITYSSDKEWIGPYPLSDNVLFRIGSSDVSQSSGISGNQLRLVFKIPKDAPPITDYDRETLGEHFSTTRPVIRFLIKTENQKGHFLFRQLVKKTVANINVKVDVRSIKSLQLESDTGNLNAEKPFYPFTTQPVKGSSFTIHYPEMLTKKWTNAFIDIQWKNTPDSFVTHYEAYKKSYLNKTSKSIFQDGMFNILATEMMEEANQPEAINEMAIAENKQPEYILNSNTDDLIVQTNDHFKATLEVSYKEEWDEQHENIILFSDPDSDGEFESEITINGTGYEIGKSGPIRLTLNQPFLHSLFPRIYTLAMTNENPETLIPNEPYTPFADTISLHYIAEENTDFTLTDELSYQSNRIQLFHEAAFGQYEEHSYLKNKSKEGIVLSKDASINTWLVPDYCKGGELFIGLENAIPTQQVSLLIQVLEGSENPLADSFSGKQKVEWAILCDNQWKNLENDILANNINNFLKSGIVKFNIPKQATTGNTLLPENYIWIRAKIHKDYDAVCKVIDIKAQAVLAEFVNNDNELSHLEHGLPAETISKLITRVPQIKSVSQPFSSFGGQPEESDAAYYRRISERLRHKNRAITLWDYEHLVLQKFSEIYKIKCLNHTSDTSFLSPGDVLLVVVPDIINKNVFDIYEPRISKATLNSIQNYINQLNTMHVEAKVINPEYEKVVVKLNVKFYDQYDENFYKKQLNEDITRFLSPWAFDNTEDITFGIELHSSILIDYIEKLYYVDYLEELEMAKHPEELDNPENPTDVTYLNELDFVQVLAPESPKHILVSAKQHAIFTDIKKCSETPIEEAETCQY